MEYLFFKSKEKKKKRKKRYVAQQRVYLTKKQGIFFKSFAKQTDTFKLTKEICKKLSFESKRHLLKEHCFYFSVLIRVQQFPMILFY